MLSTPHGFQLEILPKVGKNLTAANARQTLLTMLSHLPGFRHIETQQATLQAQRMPLLEIFIHQFLHSVSQLLKQGLRSDYVSEQGNLAFMKGKLMLSAQLRHNAVNRHKFCVDYDDYMPDCAANRLLHSALDKLLSLKLSSENQRWLYELRFAFDGIPLSRDIERYKQLTPRAWYGSLQRANGVGAIDPERNESECFAGKHQSDITFVPYGSGI